MRSLAVLALVAVLAACGFQPVNAPSRPEAGAAAVPPGAQVRVQPIPDRLGQLLRNKLVQRLSPAGGEGKPTYLLSVGLREDIFDTTFRQDETATRRNLRLRAEYRLSRANSGEVVLRGRARSTNSANILDAPYATEVSERAARERGADDLAREIALHVASHISAQ